MILGLLALLTFICRLWPILLLVILGIFIAAVRLMFLASKDVEIIEPLPMLTEPARVLSEREVQELAYYVILRRITALIIAKYPGARWVWETPDARKRIQQGQEVYILLNRAGGYRRAKVIVHNLQVIGLDYGPLEQEKLEPALEYDSPSEPNEQEETEDPKESEEQNYELLAFEWVDAHVFDLSARCNEAIGQGNWELMLHAEELPVRESWPDVCRELIRAGMEDAECLPEGIRINLNSERE